MRLDALALLAVFLCYVFPLVEAGEEVGRKEFLCSEIHRNTSIGCPLLLLGLGESYREGDGMKVRSGFLALFVVEFCG